MAELTRRDLFKAAGATAAVIGVAAVPGLASAQPRAAAQPPPGAWNHDPASPIGPLHWGTIGFPTCGTGTGQSPVNIRTDQVAAYHGPPLLLRYQQAELGIENTGHVVEVPTPAGPATRCRSAATCTRWCSTTSTRPPSTPLTAVWPIWRHTSST